MFAVDDLIGLVKSYNPNTNQVKIREAYGFGKNAHEGQYRSSGEPYFMHPVEVAMQLAKQHLDDATIITALLHDTIEDTDATYEEVSRLFGEEIAQLVDGVTKLTNLQISSNVSKQAENFRKLLVAMSQDIRVLLVKLADRLHNMRTIGSLPLEKQHRKATETMDIYAPLAGRMGMQWMREELEDLCFSVINAGARNSIIKRVEKLKEEAGDLIPMITEDIMSVLSKRDLKARVIGREKRPYSIWRKMETNHEGFSRLNDIFGFRIITDTEDDCYRILGAIHKEWHAIPGRFKDYISQPKTNGYRSLHTTVQGRNAKRVEMQIRTHEMHEVAEKGVAAHWSYKDGEQGKNPFAVDPFEWLHALSNQFYGSENPDEFLEHVKLEMFNDQVFCFTPTGEVVKLPRGATPLDFAYAIHTRIGDSSVGAKVDGSRVPLWTRLRNGQSVEIIRAEGQKPRPSWLDLVVTGRAKAAIKRSLKEADRDKFIRIGAELARVALERVGKEMSTRAISTAAKKMRYDTGEDLLALLGQGEVNSFELVKVLYPELLRSETDTASDSGAVIIGISDNQDAKPARCCNPLPGERIVGLIVKGLGVQVHAIDCNTLLDHEGENWLDLHWMGEHGRVEHAARFEVTMTNSAGVLGRITTLVGEQNSNISDMSFSDRKPDFYKITFEVEVRDIKHLLHVQTAIEAETDVVKVRRVREFDIDAHHETS